MMKDANKMYHSDSPGLPHLSKTAGGHATSEVGMTGEPPQSAISKPLSPDAKEMITKLIGHLKDNI